MSKIAKSFWKRPEGVTGALVLGGLIGGGAFLLSKGIPFLVKMMASTLSFTAMLAVLGVILYIALDPKMRALIFYAYKSAMRWITSLFIKIDPIDILKNYVADLKDNLGKMNRQITRLRSQMHVLREQIHQNTRQIDDSLGEAERARQGNQQKVLVLKSRQAGRLKESNYRLEDLYAKMQVLYRILVRMYEHSEILAEDINSQVSIKEQERAAIRASHSAMKSAMSVISGDKDKRAIFEESLEVLANDISGKVGEMEQFMEVSENFMASVDLQNGVFEEEGLKMLEKWEKEGISSLLGEEKRELVSTDTTLQLPDAPTGEELPSSAELKSRYEELFRKP